MIGTLALGAAGNLVYELFKTGASYLRNAALGSREQRALRGVYKTAFCNMFTSAAPHLDKDSIAHIESILKDFAGDPEVAEMLLGLALGSAESQPGEMGLEDLCVRFKKAGYEPDTLPVPFETLVSRFLDGLVDSLGTEVAKPDSPLFNWLTSERLNTLETLVLEIRRNLQVSLPPAATPLFLSPEEFVKRQSRNALGTFDLALVGRQPELSRLSEWLDGEKSVLVLFSIGGIGKTKLSLEFVRETEVSGSDWKPVFLRTDAEHFDAQLHELASGQPYLIVVDDAHRFEHIRRLGELLSDPALGPIKVLLVTRPVFRDSVVSFAAGRYPVEELELQPLGRGDLDSLISSPPFNIGGVGARNAILDIAKGNPLIAQAAARLVIQGKDPSGLNADAVLQAYLQDVADQVLGLNEPKGRDFLAILAGIGGLDLASSELREAIQKGLGISLADETRLVAKLRKAGILSRGYGPVRIIPDTLADHILLIWFFDRKSAQYSFRSFIAEPFFRFAGPAILRNLSEAEYKEGSVEAGSLLSEIMSDLADSVQTRDNGLRIAILKCAEGLAPLRPDDALQIVSEIVEPPESPPVTIRSSSFGQTSVEHWHVLHESTSVLEQTKYIRVADSLALLHKLSKYGHGDKTYKSVRDEASRSIKDLLELDPRKPATVFEQGLAQVRTWIKEDAESQGFAVELLGDLLKVHVSWAERAPEDQRKIVVRETLLSPSPWVRDLHRSILTILHEAYRQATSADVKKKIIDVHKNLTVYGCPRPSPALQAFLNDDVGSSIEFFGSQIEHGAELYERFAMWTWAKGLQNHGGYSGEELSELVAKIEASPLHEKYLNLVDWPARYVRDSDWRDIEKRQDKFIQYVVDQFDDSTAQTLTCELEEVITSVRKSGGLQSNGIGRLFHQLGFKKSVLAAIVIGDIAHRQLYLRAVLDSGLAGLREVDSEKALGLARGWLPLNDPLLNRAIASSYWRTHGLRTRQDLDVLAELSASDDEFLVADIVRALPSFQQVDHSRCLELLKQISARSGAIVLTQMAEVISFHGSDESGMFHFLHIDPPDLRELVWNFTRLKRLDEYRESSVDEALRRFGRVDPVGLLQFIRGRIDQEKTMMAQDADYSALSYEFHYAFDGLEETDSYPNLLREIRGWMLDAGGKMTHLTIEAAALLKQLSKGTINDQLMDVLDEWVNGSVEQQRVVAHILRDFGGQERFYKVAKSLLGSTNDNIVRAHLSDATFTTGVTWGSLASVSNKRITGYQRWLDDPATPLNARVFAKEMVNRLMEQIEIEEGLEAGEHR